MRDLAAETVKEVEEEIAAMEADFSPEQEEGPQTEENDYRLSAFRKIRVDWHEEDHNDVLQLKTKGRALVNEIFEPVYVELDEFYTHVREPIEYDDRTKRVVWKTDDDGRPEEDWDGLTLADIDRTLLRLQEIKFEVSAQVNEILLEAMFARQLDKDEYHQAFQEAKGTAEAKKAVASRASQDSRYFALMHYWMWSCSKTALKELEDVISLLRSIRSWRSQGR